MDFIRNEFRGQDSRRFVNETIIRNPKRSDGVHVTMTMTAASVR